MKTTSLFVELIIIGIGTSVWLCLMFNNLGFDLIHWVKPFLEYEILFTGFALSFIYILGIVTDRLADNLLEFHGKNVRSKIYPNREDIIIDKVVIYNNATPLVDMIDYGRSRLRICRGWLLNLVIILIVGNWHLVLTTSKTNIIIFNIFILLFTVSLYYAWRNLSIKEYEKIKNISQALRDQM